jgi:microcystin synthetase protein McyJ
MDALASPDPWDVKRYRSPGEYILEHYTERIDDLEYPLWMNLGYWRRANRYADACRALAGLVADAASLGPGDVVLDAGCGYGEPARFWIERYGPRAVIGVNIDQTQCSVGAQRSKGVGLGAVHFVLGSATRLPVRDESVDKAIALESAFYFDTRDEFFAEAYRVLRPGGVMVLADLLPTPTWRSTERNRRVRWYSMKPEENVYPLDEYLRHVETAGFCDVRAESIRDDVFPGIAKVVASLKEGARLDELTVAVSEEERRTGVGAEMWEEDLGLGDFAIVRAIRPLTP